VPSNIAKKVIEDLMEFGNVQTAILGIKGGELNNKVANNLEIENTEGFYISEVTENSGAKKAGLKANDIIIKLNDVKISTYADLTGFLRTKRPDDTIVVAFLREGEEMMVNVILTKNEVSTVSNLGMVLKNLDAKELKNLDIANGVKITEITNKELAYYGVKEGFVIIAINNEKVYGVDDVTNLITNKSKGAVIRIEMINLNGEIERYIFR
jgi:S1-C subfamily serine protease